ncbi:MAG: hypothetical protein AUJ97_05970 [Bacteroidetes bacterium CG2_30_32_10]|nr:MAG: hypothetical protein AUJ97_05970 [Bacteroidetes bacterium CG2_30_32_10]
MKINRNNYEEFFLDYFDGNLNSPQVSELFVFINKNPDIKEEFDSFENISLVVDDEIVFEDKESLKKKDIISFGSIDSSNYEMFFVAEVENDLSEKESKEVHFFIQKNPHLAETYHLLKLSKLKPDTSIIFENKDNLKKNEIVAVGSINKTNYEIFFIDDCEGDLTLEEAQNLEKFVLQNKHLLKELNLFKQTKLIPDTTIVYNNKKELKKFVIASKTKENSSFYKYIAIAASIFIVFGIYFLMIQNRKKTLTASINPVNRDVFDNSSKIGTRNGTSNKFNKEIKPNLAINLQHINENTLFSVHPTQIAYIPIEKVNKDKIVTLRGSAKPITFNNDLLADNSDMQNNKSSEPLTIKEFLISKFRKNINQSDKEFNQPHDRITGWDIAQAGVAGINKFTKNDIQLKKDVLNPDNSYALIGKNFSFSKNYNTK